MTTESSSSLLIERSIYVANIISGILYGVLVYMVFQSYHLLKSFKKEHRSFYIFYGFIQLFLVTVEFSLNAFAGQLMWIDHRDWPGGPFAYYISMRSSWHRICVLTCAVVSIGMADGLLLYRCYVIWNDNYRVILLPILMYVAEIAMGIAVPIQAARLSTTFMSKPTANFLIPWASLQCSLTALLTALIVGRIFYISREIKLRTRSSTDHTGIVSMLVEPAFPLSFSGIAFAVCVGQKFYLKVPFAHIWGMLVAIAPQSIILRVAMGRAWTENVASTLTWTIEVAGHTSTTLTQRSQKYDTPDDFRIKSEVTSKGIV